ncbi:hypothetical protein GN244_ATG19966 [Phytophthora infestans]|uniref:Uncharacterized protein n=2 Tax=Phytophthora infestans TaxID=4787 RepID=A0A833S6K4_PHYIN|nr:hypothetical protein GN244_ATG19966 [Phytophthora infestans]
MVAHYAMKRLIRRALTTLEYADHLELMLQEKDLNMIRALSEKYGVFTDLIAGDLNTALLGYNPWRNESLRNSMNGANMKEMIPEVDKKVLDDKVTEMIQFSGKKRSICTLKSQQHEHL